MNLSLDLLFSILVFILLSRQASILSLSELLTSQLIHAAVLMIAPVDERKNLGRACDALYRSTHHLVYSFPNFAFASHPRRHVYHTGL